MKSGLKHIDVGSELTKTEWESEESHELVHGTSFPVSPVERQLFYRDDEHKWYIYNGSSWVWLGGGSMSVHGNEYHDPDFATESALSTHEADEDAHHARYTDAEAKAQAEAAKLDDHAAPDDNTDLDATASKHGLMPKADKSKLDGIEAGADVTANHDPKAHKTSHHSGGGDAIKLDDLAAPDDNTDLNASTSKHGLLPKLGGGTSNFLRADGSWAAPGGGGGTKIQDADQDTKVDVEESADEDKIRMDVKGVESFLLEDDGILTLAKQSAFRAHRESSQSIPTSTATKVEFDHEDYDIQGEYDVVTDFDFTAKKAGLYLLSAVCTFREMSDGDRVIVNVFVNDVNTDRILDLHTGGAGHVCGSGAVILKLDAGDVVYLSMFHDHGSNINSGNESRDQNFAMCKIA